MREFLTEINEMHMIAFDRSLRAKNRAELTIRAYEEALIQLEEWVDGDDLMTIPTADIEDYIGYLLEHFADTTAGSRFRNLRAFYNWAVRDEIIDRSPMSKLSEPSAELPVMPVIPDEDIRALLATCKPRAKAGGGKPTYYEQFTGRRDEAIIRMFCEAGSPRAAEMAGLTLGQMDMRHSRFLVHGKGRKDRWVPFGVKTGRALDFYLRLRAKHELAHLDRLWIGRRGYPFTASGIRQMFAVRCDDASIGHIHPHLLRHTSAHVWKLEGGSEEDMMELFGWKNPDMPRRYGASARQERAQRAARKMSPADRL